MKTPELTAEYSEKIRPLLPLAKRAYGSRDQKTPAHDASRQYTEMLVEFVNKGGSMIELAKALEVSYAGMRRRVMTASLPAMNARAMKKALSQEEIDAAVARVAEARARGSRHYHSQLALEYQNGVSLSAIAKGLGIKNAGPLYYGVQRHALKSSASAE